MTDLCSDLDLPGKVPEILCGPAGSTESCAPACCRNGLAPMGREEAKADAERSIAPSTNVDKESILEEAQKIIHGPRRQSYGHPRQNHQTIADVLSAILDNRPNTPEGYRHNLTAEDAAVIMLGVKLARLTYMPTHRDSVVDVAGYAGCLAIITGLDET